MRCRDVLAGLVLLAASAATADPVALFDWSEDRCSLWDVPDAPARFWRDADGTVLMLAGNDANRLSIGPDLYALERPCAIVHAGAEDPDPAARDDRVWIAATHTRDGRHIEALGHAEYHGHDHPGVCVADSYMACWRNAIVALESDDGGRGFHRIPGPPVAALPYRYDPGQTRRSGYFNPSNMVEAGGYLHVFFFADAYGAQKRGVCLARRPLDGAPGDWRAWDGAGFGTGFVDPYAGPVEYPERHVCTPLPGLRATLSTVVHQPETGRYLAVSPMVAEVGRTRTAGIWALVSTDLVHWENRGLLLALPLLWARDCATDVAHAYPALVDPDSRDRNFGTVGETFWLTVTRMAQDGDCRIGPDRDLVRYDVSWPAQARAPSVVRAPATDRP